MGRGPWWLPVRTHHHIYSPYLKCIDHQGPPLREIPAVLKVDAYWNQFITSGWENTCGHGPTPVGRDKSGPYAPYTIIRGAICRHQSLLQSIRMDKMWRWMK